MGEEEVLSEQYNGLFAKKLYYFALIGVNLTNYLIVHYRSLLFHTLITFVKPKIKWIIKANLI
jgi:hypothetical protein